MFYHLWRKVFNDIFIFFICKTELTCDWGQMRKIEEYNQRWVVTRAVHQNHVGELKKIITQKPILKDRELISGGQPKGFLKRSTVDSDAHTSLRTTGKS